MSKELEALKNRISNLEFQLNSKPISDQNVLQHSNIGNLEQNTLKLSALDGIKEDLLEDDQGDCQEIRNWINMQNYNKPKTIKSRDVLKPRNEKSNNYSIICGRRVDDQNSSMNMKLERINMQKEFDILKLEKKNLMRMLQEIEKQKRTLEERKHKLANEKSELEASIAKFEKEKIEFQKEKKRLVIDSNDIQREKERLIELKDRLEVEHANRRNVNANELNQLKERIESLENENSLLKQTLNLIPKQNPMQIRNGGLVNKENISDNYSSAKTHVRSYSQSNYNTIQKPNYNQVLIQKNNWNIQKLAELENRLAAVLN